MADDAKVEEPASEPVPEKVEPADAKPETYEVPTEQVKSELAETPKPPGGGKLKSIWRKWWGNKKVFVPTALGLVLLVLLLIPATRYAVAGLVLKRHVNVQVLDGSTNEPVSEAIVKLGGQSQLTNGEGYASFNDIKPGHQTVLVSKQFYNDGAATELVRLSGALNFSISMNAAGHAYTLVVQNLITKQPLGDALVKFSGTQSRTDSSGKTQLVQPVTTKEVQVELSHEGYVNGSAKLALDASSQADLAATLLPEGKVYYLSKSTGTINVMKAGLDGSKPKVVVAGTGDEDSNTTSLLPSPDWHYLVLRAQRSGDHDGLYLINTTNDSMTNFDQGNADFRPIGWTNGRFVYEVTSKDLNDYQTGKDKIKSYNPTSGQLATLDQTIYTGKKAVIEQLGDVNLLDAVVAYTKQYYTTDGSDVNKDAGIFTINPDGTGKRTIKTFGSKLAYLNMEQVKPNELYVLEGHSGTYYTLIGTTLAPTALKQNEFYDSHTTYYRSPDNTKTLWSENRDGRAVVFIGNAAGDEAKEIAKLEDDQFDIYGWFSQDYVLYSKNASQLFIGGVNGSDPIKITDYHKPDYGYYGYGGAY